MESDIRALGQDHVLVIASTAGFMPGSYTAVYNDTKAFLNSYSFALRNELKNTGVTYLPYGTHIHELPITLDKVL